MADLVNMLFGSVSDPIQMAFVFMIFLAVINALFSFIGSLFDGVIYK